MSNAKSSAEGLFARVLGTKEKGVTKQRGKSKDRYHEDPPEIPNEYDSEEETTNVQDKQGGQKSLRSLFKPPSNKASGPQRDDVRLGEHEAKPKKSHTKGGGRETPKKSAFQSVFGTKPDGKEKKKSKDRYHQENPYEKQMKGESDGGGGGWLSGGGGGGGSDQSKGGKSKGRSAGKQSKGGGFSLPTF